MNGRGEFFSEELLSGYLDGELSDEQRRYVEQELDNDPRLREEYRALQTLSDRLGGMERPRLSTEAASRLHRALEAAREAGTGGQAAPHAEDAVVSAYFDGELSEHERQVVAQHLEQDDQQRRYFDRLCTLHRRLALLPVYRLDDGFANRVLRQIEALSSESSSPTDGQRDLLQVAVAPGPSRRPRAMRWRGAFWALAAIATAILLMVFAPRGSDPIGLPIAGNGHSLPDVQPDDGRVDGEMMADGTSDSGLRVEPPGLQPEVVPPRAAASPFTLVGSLRRSRLVLVYEVFVTEDGVRDVAFSNLLRRHGIGFAETSAISRQEQHDLLRHRFLDHVQIADDRRADMDRVDLYLVRTTARTADALYADLMTRPAGIGSFALNLTTRDAEARVLNRLCESTGLEDKAGKAIQLLANFGILSSTGRNLGAFGTIRWVDPILYEIPEPRPEPHPDPVPPHADLQADADPPAQAEDFAPPAAPLDFPCELLFVVRQAGVMPQALANPPGQP